jgi:hypothetical protein
MDDRLSIDSKYKKNVILDIIDKYDVLKLQSKGERTDIFMLALSLGVKDGHRTRSIKSEGLVLESTAKGKDSVISYITSVALNDLKKENREEEINNPETVYGIVEEYANTGFAIMEKIFSDYTNKNEDFAIYELIEMMDIEYENIMKNNI